MKQPVTVPMDVYNSPQEMVIVLPLGGVAKTTIKLQLSGLQLKISGKREHPSLKESLMPMQEQCFWGEFAREVDLPSNTVFDKIESDLSPDNILTIVIPKVTTPEELVVDIR